MKSELGISYTKLLIILGIIIIIGVIIGNSIKGMFKEENLEELKTNMLVIQTKVKVLKGESDVNKDANILKGQKISNPEKPADIQSFLDKKIISEEDYDYFYILNQENLNELGLTSITLKSGAYFIVNYDTYEVIYTLGYTDQYGNTYYKLTDIQDLVY